MIRKSAQVGCGGYGFSLAGNALGRRVSTTDGGGTVYHVYNGAQCVADLDANGNPLRSYTWGPGIDNLLAITVHSAGSTNSYYAVKDHLGSVRALVDVGGAVVESYTYDAWGNVLTGGQQSAIGNRYLWQGREYSFATGLYNFRARWYDPQSGRWLSKDPIGLEGGLNLYAFCGDDPVSSVDPDGLRRGDLIYYSRKPGSDFPYHVGYDLGNGDVLMYRPSLGQVGVWDNNEFLEETGYGIAGYADTTGIISPTDFMKNVSDAQQALQKNKDTMCVDMPVAGFGDKWPSIKDAILKDYQSNSKPYTTNTPHGTRDPYFFRRNSTFKQYWIGQGLWRAQ